MRFFLLFVISMSIVYCAVEAGCKGSKCHKRRKNEETRGQDNDPLDKVEDMEAKKKEKPKSEEESEEEEEEKKPQEEAAAARFRRAEKELHRESELGEEELDGIVVGKCRDGSSNIKCIDLTDLPNRKHLQHHHHRRHVTGYKYIHSKEEQEPVGSVKDANLIEHNSPQRFRREAYKGHSNEKDAELAFRNVRNSPSRQLEEEGRSRHIKDINRRLSDKQNFAVEAKKTQVNWEDVHLPKFGKLGPRGRERVLPLPTEDREFPFWRKSYKEV